MKSLVLVVGIIFSLILCSEASRINSRITFDEAQYIKLTTLDALKAAKYMKRLAHPDLHLEYLTAALEDNNVILAGAIVDVCDFKNTVSLEERFYILQSVVNSGHLDATRFVLHDLRMAPQINVAYSEFGAPVLAWATEKSMIDMLVDEFGADLDAKTVYGEPIEHFCCCFANSQTAELINAKRMEMIRAAEMIDFGDSSDEEETIYSHEVFESLFEKSISEAVQYLAIFGDLKSQFKCLKQAFSDENFSLADEIINECDLVESLNVYQKLWLLHRFIVRGNRLVINHIIEKFALKPYLNKPYSILGTPVFFFAPSKLVLDFLVDDLGADLNARSADFKSVELFLSTHDEEKIVIFRNKRIELEEAARNDRMLRKSLDDMLRTVDDELTTALRDPFCIIC